jgi:hypothetical protein
MSIKFKLFIIFLVTKPQLRNAIDREARASLRCIRKAGALQTSAFPSRGLGTRLKELKRHQ